MDMQLNTSSPAGVGVSVEPNPVRAPVRTTRRVGIFKRAIGFTIWVGSGFGLLTLLLRGKGKASETAVVYTVHPTFYLWLLIVSGFVGAGLVHRFPGWEGALGWIYLWAVVYTFASLLFDLSTARLLFWVGIFCFLWLGSSYLENLKHLPVVTHVVTYFRSLHPRFDTGFALALSTLLTPAWIGSLLHSFTEGQKTFTPNSIEERFVGHGCEISDRSGLKFRVRYRDLLESLLGFGSADLEAIDGTGQVVKRWNNILFLAFTWKKLDEILHQRAAVVDNAPNDPVEVEEVR